MTGSLYALPTVAQVMRVDGSLSSHLLSLLWMTETGSSLLNSTVAPVVERALAAIKLGRIKFTKIQLGNAKPQLNNIRLNFV